MNYSNTNNTVENGSSKGDMLVRNTSFLNAFGVYRDKIDIGVSSGKISFIENHDETRETEGFRQVVEGDKYVLTPGFVNAHSHVPMVLLRGYGEDMKLQRWLFDRIFPFEDQLDGEAVYYGSLLGIAEMISSGTTSFSDMYYFCDKIAQAVDESGIKANIGRGISVFDGSDFDKTAAYSDLLDLIIRYSNHKRIKIDVAPHSEYTTNPKVLEQVAKFAGEKGLRVQVHVSETELEHRESVLRNGKTPAKVMDDAGIFKLPTTLAHGVWLSDSDMDILAKNNVFVAHCPQSNLKLGCGIADVARMRKKGIFVAIGTDSAASNNNLDLVAEMRLAALLAKGVSQDPLVMPAGEAINMATRMGALSQGREDCGDIEVGFKADLVAFNKNSIAMTPGHDYLADILYSVERNDVAMTVVDGEILYKDGEFKTIDIEKVKFEVKANVGKILHKLKG